MNSLKQNIKTYLDNHPRFKKAQSFLELAVILPILLLLILGVVELSFMVSEYLDLLDLTREAARFASVRDPFDPVASDHDCSTQDLFDYYYDTACIFSPPAGSASCIVDDPFCNGLNQFMIVNPDTDDIVISVYTVSDLDESNPGTRDYKVQSVAPAKGYWAYSEDILGLTDGDGNWTRDCQGNTIRTEPYYTETSVDARLNKATPENASTPSMSHGKGFVAVEFYYCYDQVLKVFTLLAPDPMRLHAYTLMSLPAAAPTATPYRTDTPSP